MIGLALFLVIIATAAIFFPYPYEPTQPPKANDTGLTKEGVQEVVNANNKFALELYSELNKEEKENIFFSPYSIFSALAITYEGARGQTAEEIKSVFHFPETNILRPNFAAIYNEINKGYKDYELRTGNALWIQKDYPLLEDYTKSVKEYYGAKAANLDFARETEKSRQTINEFIENQTNGKIKDLIPQGFLIPQTRLVITNAIYFKGTWEWEFDPTETKEMDFKINPNNTAKVPMMHMEPKNVFFNYTETEDLQILELPYKGNEISMLILLSKENKTIEPLTIEKIEEWKEEMRETELEAIYLPKFEFKTKYNLNDILKTLGMKSAFDPGKADFSGMTITEKVWIDFVLHQAYVKVDEKGTEAAAATAVGILGTGLVSKPIFKADHPFIFIIQQKATGNILFLGKVVDPTKVE